ncbi:unnamed protein product [Haemonchus placei]|uniref:Uncharacterized protein n=1 Tax=Haemonchus placei TaxID=6290 RepID=A0A0N4W9I1_HAEPC|nr:unnamed protein product [Haemonchus placei]
MTNVGIATTRQQGIAAAACGESITLHKTVSTARPQNISHWSSDPLIYINNFMKDEPNIVTFSELEEDFFPWIFARADRMFRRAMTTIQLENSNCSNISLVRKFHVLPPSHEF